MSAPRGLGLVHVANYQTSHISCFLMHGGGTHLSL